MLRAAVAADECYTSGFQFLLGCYFLASSILSVYFQVSIPFRMLLLGVGAAASSEGAGFNSF